MDSGRDRFNGSQGSGSDTSGEHDERVEHKHILTPKDVAEIFGVSPKTVHRWGVEGKLAGFRTPGGHFRFRRSDVEAFFVERS